MTRIAFVLSALLSLASAQSVDELVREALENNPSLEGAQARITQSRAQKEISKNFDNPSIQLQINDIQTQDISNRSIEPMQFESLSIQQKIPFFGKRDARHEDAQATQRAEELSLAQLRATLTAEVKKTAYRIWQIEQEIRIYTDFETLVRQNEKLYTALVSTAASGRHMGIMASQMDLSQIKITLAGLAEEKERAYADLSQLCARKVETVESELSIGRPETLETYESALSNNFGYRAREARVRSADARLEQARLDAYPDVTVQVGYSRRQSFNDYWSAGVNIPLPIYGTEAAKEQISRAKVLEQTRERETEYLRLGALMRQKYAEMARAAEVWRIIHDESLPQLQHMFELSEASIRNGEDLFRFTELLKQKLQLELQQVRSVAAYRRAQAELDQLTGKES